MYYREDGRIVATPYPVAGGTLERAQIIEPTSYLGSHYAAFRDSEIVV